MKTVVALTPLALEADSRTLKQALSLARSGYRSIVVEGTASASLPKDLPITVVSLNRGVPKPTQRSLAPSAEPRKGLLHSLWQSLRLNSRNPLLFWTAALGFRAHYYYSYVARLLFRLPRADLYVLHSYEFHPCVALLRGKRVPIVYDAHDFYAGIRPDNEKTPLDRHLDPLLHSIERRCAAASETILTVGGNIACLIRAHLENPSHGSTSVAIPRIVVVRNVHDYRLDSIITTSIREACGLDDHAFLLVIVGNLKNGMALGPLLAALELCEKRVHVAFLGRGYERAAERVRSSPVAARVHLLGSVPPDVVVPFIAGGDAAAIIYSSYSENYRNALPNGFFQSIAAKLPLICGDLPEIAQIVRFYGNGLLTDVTDPGRLADSIDALATNAELWADLRLRAAEACKAFRWEDEEEVFLGVVDEAIAETSSNAQVTVEKTLN